MFPRSLRTELNYMAYRRQHKTGCGYCQAYEEKSTQVLETYRSMMILRAKFPYARWDNWKVGEHLMVIPIRHTASFSKLTDEESADMMTVIKQYESDGYSFYIRSAANRSRSMQHIHGHLIAPKS